MAGYNIYDPRFAIMNKNIKNGTNSIAMSQDNRNLVIQLIRKYKCVSRKEIAEYSGLNPATITNIMQEFLKSGLVYESGMLDGGNGRRVKGFSLSKELYVITVRVTRAYINVGLYDVAMNPVYVKKAFYKQDDVVTEIMSTIKEHIAQIETIVDKKCILSVMVGLSHDYKFIDGEYYLQDHYRKCLFNIGKELHDQYSYRVVVNRAINYTAFDIWHRYKKCANKTDDYITLICVQLSYDLESAIMVNHEILYGMNGTCGKIQDHIVLGKEPKTFGQLCSVVGILKRAEELRAEYRDSTVFSHGEINIRHIVKGYQDGDPLSERIYTEIIEMFAPLFASIIDFLDPDVIILEDEVPTGWKFEKNLQQEVAKYTEPEKALRVVTLLHEFGERETKNDPALIGAARCAFDLMISQIGLYN